MNDSRQTVSARIDSQWEALTRLRSYRLVAVLISSLAFLSAVGAYYVTGYLRFRFVVYDADALYLPLLYDDIVAGIDLAGWHTSSVPYIFPDALLLFFLRAVISNVHVALIVFGVVQILLFTSGLLLLAWQLYKSFQLEHFVLLLLAGSLFFASLSGLHAYTQMFAVSVYHFGVVVVMPYAFAAAVAFMRSGAAERKRRWLSLLALAVLLTFSLMSDLFAAVQIYAPLVGGLILLWLLRKVRLKPVVIGIGLAAGAAIAGYLFLQSVPVLRESFNAYSGHTGYAVMQSLSDLASALNNLRLNSPWHVVLIVAFTALCTVIIVREALGCIRHRQTRPNYIVFFAATFLILLVLNPLSVVATSVFKKDTGLRYLLPLLILPAFWGWPHLLEFFISDRVRRASAVLGLGLLVVLAVGNGLLIAPHITQVRLDDFYPKWVSCIDDAAQQYDVKQGLAGYWRAKPLTFLSKQRLEVVQVYDNLGPYLWINNARWYDLEPEFVVIDTQLQDIRAAELQDRFGPPAAVVQCQQRFDIWIYNRPTDALFRQQLKSSPFLARLGQADDSVEFHAALLPGEIGEKVGLSRKVADGKSGFLTYGPYLELPAGRYRLQIDYQIEGALDNIAHWDVVLNGEVATLGALPAANTVFQKDFELVAPAQVEIRTFYEGHGVLTVDSLQITRIE